MKKPIKPRYDGLSDAKELSSPEPGSIHCNGQLVKYHRNKCGLTQTDLAIRAGFSRRLIVKAEAGEQLESESIDIIAAALREAGAIVSTCDLICDPVALTRRFLKSYVEFQADCVQHCLDFISPEIVAVVDGDPATNPIAGTYHGIQEFDGLWRKFFAMFVRDRGSLGDNPEIRCGGNEVLAWGHEYVRIPEVPPREPGFVMLRLTFERGQMVRFEDYYESTGMMMALNHFAPQFPNAKWVKLLREKVLESAGEGATREAAKRSRRVPKNHRLRQQRS